MLTGPQASGLGLYLDGGILVKAGSLARKEIVPTGKGISAAREELIRSGVLTESGNQLLFEKDHQFKTPSGAAGVILGRKVNGWEAWKRPDGSSLSKVMRVSRKARRPYCLQSRANEFSSDMKSY